MIKEYIVKNNYDIPVTYIYLYQRIKTILIVSFTILMHCEPTFLCEFWDLLEINWFVAI